MAGTRKGTYKIANWSKYNESLVQRGSITFWFSEDVIENWHHATAQPKVGHPFVYSDSAVECLLVLRELFQLPYRQTEGLGRSLAELMQIALDIPDFTSLAKRAAKMGVSPDVRKHVGPIDVVVDSTGLIQLPPNVLELFPPNTMVRVIRTEHGIEMRAPSEPDD